MSRIDMTTRENLGITLSDEISAEFSYFEAGQEAGVNVSLRAYVLDRVGDAEDMAALDDSQAAEIRLLSQALPPTHDAYSCWTGPRWS